MSHSDQPQADPLPTKIPSMPTARQITDRLAAFRFTNKQMCVFASTIQTAEQLEEIYDQFRTRRLEVQRTRFLNNCRSQSMTEGADNALAWLICQAQCQVGPQIKHPLLIDHYLDLDSFTETFEDTIRVLCPPEPEGWYIRFKNELVTLWISKEGKGCDFEFSPGNAELTFWIAFADKLSRNVLRRSALNDNEPSKEQFPSDLVSIVEFAEALRKRAR